MKSIIKRIIKSSIFYFINTLNRTKIGRLIQDHYINSAMERTIKINHNSLSMLFSTPNKLCYWRAETFSSKEPETLEWIDKFPEESCFWDVGANIGLYSVYAAKQCKAKVYAFEPSVFNLELLARNIYLNNLVERVCIISNPLSEKNGVNNLKMTSMEWGEAGSTFGENYGYDGKNLENIFEYKIIGLSMDDVLTWLLIPQPDFIKIDVDGIEPLILKGGLKVLKKVKELLIEVNDDFLEQAIQCEKILIRAGFVLKEKKHSEMIHQSPGFNNTYNQIWIKN